MANATPAFSLSVFGTAITGDCCEPTSPPENLFEQSIPKFPDSGARARWDYKLRPVQLYSRELVRDGSVHLLCLGGVLINSWRFDPQEKFTQTWSLKILLRRPSRTNRSEP